MGTFQDDTTSTMDLGSSTLTGFATVISLQDRNHTERTQLTFIVQIHSWYKWQCELIRVTLTIWHCPCCRWSQLPPVWWWSHSGSSQSSDCSGRILHSHRHPATCGHKTNELQITTHTQNRSKIVKCFLCPLSEFVFLYLLDLRHIHNKSVSQDCHSNKTKQKGLKFGNLVRDLVSRGLILFR